MEDNASTEPECVTVRIGKRTLDLSNHYSQIKCCAIDTM